MVLIDQYNMTHEVAGQLAGPQWFNGPRGRSRYLFDGAYHPKGHPIRFKSIPRLINWAANNRGLILRQVQNTGNCN